ncbi:hypothetical protein JOF53_004607 [Crossiella equi]|uniref:Uncharacterized protein n=1 Tax=Crossiella equi TaxID=130796 RepID=A0ABS5AJ62_9PSEU|nr:hypothetical protein [Crossiella equi]
MTVAPGTEVRIAVHVRAEPDGSVRVAATLVAPPVQ